MTVIQNTYALARLQYTARALSFAVAEPVTDPIERAILIYFAINPGAGPAVDIADAAKFCGASPEAVRKNIDLLAFNWVLERVGPDSYIISETAKADRPQ